MTGTIQSNLINGELINGDDFIITTAAGFPVLRNDATSHQLSLGFSEVSVQHAGLSVLRTRAAASGGLQVNNTATGSGFERVLTESDLNGVGTSDFLTLASDFIVNNSIGETPSGWSYTFLAGVQYSVKIVAFMENPAAASGLRLYFSGSSDVQIYNTNTIRTDPVTADNAEMRTIFSSGGGGWLIGDTGGPMGAVIETAVLCTANKTMDFIFGQSPATVGNSILKQGSFVQITRMTA
jgi:hypothetical protein